MTDISVVLPCYRAAPIARRSVDALRLALSATGLAWEVLIVDDGGGDFATAEWSDDAQVTLLRLATNCGKGAAVRHGMLAATGAVRIFTDVDLPFGMQALEEMISILCAPGVHVVIGDRTLPASEYRMHLDWRRRAASLAFTAFVGTIVTGGFYDTQCGLKGVRGDVAEALFPVLRIDRFAFDVELVYVALKHRLRIVRIPVRLQHNETSSVRLLRDSVRGFIDIFRIRYHFTRRWYESPALREISRRDRALASAMPGALPEATRG